MFRKLSCQSYCCLEQLSVWAIVELAYLSPADVSWNLQKPGWRTSSIEYINFHLGVTPWNLRVYHKVLTFNVFGFTVFSNVHCMICFTSLGGLLNSNPFGASLSYCVLVNASWRWGLVKKAGYPKLSGKKRRLLFTKDWTLNSVIQKKKRKAKYACNWMFLCQ